MNEENVFRFGASQAVITPPPGTSLAGYFTDRKADGVHDDLFAKILVLGRGKDEIMIISCDLVGVPSEFSAPLRQAVSGETGIPADAIMFCATHTHTGPVMRGEMADRDYIKSISDKIISHASTARRNMREGAVEYGSCSLEGYAFNRRYLMKNGSVVTNPGLNNPDVVEPAAPVDYSVNVIRFSDKNGKTGAVMVNCALHPDTVSGTRVSADWPGYLSARLAEKLGGEPVVLVLNGSAGDINHFDVLGKRLEQNIEEARRIGFAYGDKAAEVCGKTRPVEIDRLGAAFETAKIPARKIKDEELDKARALVEKYGDEYKIEESGKQLESQDIARGDKTVMVFFAQKLLSFSENFGGTTINLPVHALRIGDVALVGIGGELFTEIGLRIKSGKIFRDTLVVELANGYEGYLPTARAFGEGGYEVMPRETSKVGEEAEKIIAETSERLLEKLADKN